MRNSLFINYKGEKKVEAKNVIASILSLGKQRTGKAPRLFLYI